MTVHATHLMEDGRCIGCAAEPWMPIAAYRCEGLKIYLGKAIRQRLREHVDSLAPEEKFSGAMPACWQDPHAPEEATPRRVAHPRELLATGALKTTVDDLARDTGTNAVRLAQLAREVAG